MKRWFIRTFITPLMARDLERRYAVRRANRKHRKCGRVML